MLLGSVGLLSLAILCHVSSQTVLGRERLGTGSSAQFACAAPHDDGPFTPVEKLSDLSSGTFTTLGHPSFPGHSVRIKQTVFECDPDLKAYTGYIDFSARHLFYFFFESRNNPATDDVIMWINGGPGCVSSMGLYMEHGPCKVLAPGGPVYNPYSWNTNASVFYVDQPVGVGFSYAEYNQTVSTTEEAANDIAAFLAIFFKTFSAFQGNAFHMSGESYAGHYLPIFAAKVHDQNDLLAAAGQPTINLRSVIIGNGIVDYFSLYPTYIDVQCTNASISPPISSISTCLDMKKAVPLCQEWTIKSCIHQFDAQRCAAARAFCDNSLSDPYSNSGLNPYDISKKCEGPPSVLCYPVMQYMIDYLSNTTVRQELGVSPAVPANFEACSDAVNVAFNAALDEYHETYSQLAQLLERGVHVLVYAGTYDWICNWISNERWTLKMPWTGQGAFVSQPLREWEVDGVVVGKTRAAGGLAYVTVDKAGHMVPFDKPREALVLLQRWLFKEPF